MMITEYRALIYLRFIYFSPLVTHLLKPNAYKTRYKTLYRTLYGILYKTLYKFVYKFTHKCLGSDPGPRPQWELLGPGPDPRHLYMNLS